MTENDHIIKNQCSICNIVLGQVMLSASYISDIDNDISSINNVLLEFLAYTAKIGYIYDTQKNNQ